jgi:AcrR family transcriptional regulator
MPRSAAPVDARRPRASALPPSERRSMIIEATLPLIVEHGEMVTTRQIADAAGIAEGTIFRVFADKDEVIAAAVEAALDVEPLERTLGEIESDLPFERHLEEAVAIIQQRVVDIWRLMSRIGPKFQPASPRQVSESDALRALFEVHERELTIDPSAAARLLRGVTLAASHPMLADEAMSPAEIVRLFLHGVIRRSPC